MMVEEADLLPEQLEHIARYANDIRVTNASHKEPYEKLDQLSRYLAKEGLTVSQNIDKLDLVLQRRAVARIFSELVGQLLKETHIQKQEWGVSIFRFFETIILHILPYRLTDIDFVCMVNEQIFENTAPLYSAIKRAETYVNEQQEVVQPHTPLQVMNALQLKTRAMRRYEIENQYVVKNQEGGLNGFKCWRNTLKVGDIIDAVKEVVITQAGEKSQAICKAWTRAQIKYIQEEEFEEDESEQVALQLKNGEKPMFRVLLLSMVGETEEMDAQKGSDDLNIAPLGMHTSAWDWRMSLKVNDAVDACDEYSHWYQGYVLSVREREGENAGKDCLGEPLKEILVAFRFYDQELGHRPDPQGRMYVGWNQKYDSLRSFTCTSIHPPGSMATKYCHVINNRMEVRSEVPDKHDISYLNMDRARPCQYTEIRSPVESNRVNNGLAKNALKIDRVVPIIDALNEFGRRGCYNHILELIDSYRLPGCKLDVFVLIQLLQFLYKVSYHFTRQFSCNYLPALSEVFVAAVLDEESQGSPFVVGNADKEKLLYVTYTFEHIMHRYLVPEMAELANMVNYTKLGIALFKQQNLEKRIKGLKYITDQTRLHNQLLPVNLMKSRLKRELKGGQVFAYLFSGKFYHSQLVQRANELLRWYAVEEMLESEEVDMLWETSQQEESTKQQIYAIVADVAFVLDCEVLSLFMAKMGQMEPIDMNERELEFLYNLVKLAYTNEKPKEAAGQIFWQIATLERRGYAKELLKPARKHLIELVKTSDRSAMEALSLQCIELVARQDETVSAVQALVILHEILQGYPKHQNWVGMVHKSRLPTQKDFLHQLVKDHHLLDHLLRDLQCYTSKAKSLLERGLLTPDNVDVFLIGEEEFTHQQNLQARLNLISFVQEGTDGEVKIEQEQLNQVSDNLLYSTGFGLDRELFFKWLRKLLQKNTWIQPEFVQQFFREKILQNSKLVHDIKFSGFTCISQMFLQVNEYKGHIDMISKPDIYDEEEEQPQQDSPQKLKQPLQRNNFLDFKSNVAPHLLEGIEIVWQMFQHAPVNDKKVRQKASQFLALIYQSMLGSAEYKGEVYASFIRECFARVQADEGGELVVKITGMLKNFFTDTEKQGTVRLRQHKTLDDESYTIKNLLVISNIKSVPYKYMLFNVDSSLTVWELYDIVARLYDKSPLRLTLTRMTSNKPELKETDFCKSLAEMKFQDNEELYTNRQVRQRRRAPLFNTLTQELTPQLKSIFEEWFDKYSVPDETHGRIITPEKCLVIFEAGSKSTGNEQSPGHGQMIKNMFEQEGLNPDDKITLQIFIRFYRYRAIIAQDMVWQNLTAEEIGPDLTREPKQDKHYDNDSNVTKEQALLPRVQIANNQEYLGLLFGMDEQEVVWDLIASLKTNKEMYMQILTNDSETLQALTDPDLLDKTPMHKLLYWLQIMKYLLKQGTQSVSTTTPDEVALYTEKKEDEKKENENSKSPVKGEVSAEQIVEDAEERKHESANFRKLRDWKGDVRKEKIEHSLFQREEAAAMIGVSEDLEAMDGCTQFRLLHEQWLVDFLQKGGFDALVNILMTLIRAQRTSSPAESRSLSLTTYIIRVLLVGCFAASGDQELFQQKDYTAVLTNNRGLASDLLQKLNDSVFLELLQTLFEIIVRKRQENKEGVVIVSEALKIWTSFIAFKPHLVKSLYEGRFVSVLVDQGLLGQNAEMRKSFKDALVFVCLNVKQGELAEAPAIFFLRVLLEKLQLMTTFDARNTLQYFELFSQLTQQYLLVDQKTKLFDETELFHDLVKLLEGYPSHETKQNAEEYCDYTLGGLLAITTDLLKGAYSKKMTVFKAKQGLNFVVVLLVQQLLFGSVDEKQIKQITHPAQLNLFDEAASYKCHHQRSREAAYKLLLFVVDKYLTSEELMNLVSEYWCKMITKMERPPAISYDPSQRNRASNGFAGLKNLGSTCYMNSMLQQFFNVPIFRYSVLSAIDKISPNIEEFEGRQIDDNLLHQLQRLFAALELSDRQDYNTRDFCYSYKDNGQPVNVRVQQDASEFLNVAFERLESMLKESEGEKYLCQNVFQGETAGLMVCNECGNIVQRDEEFYLLSVQVKDKKDVYDSLQQITAGEIISDYKCESCQKKVDITKKTVIKRLPNTLIVHLNRIIFDMDRFANVKVNDRFEFPKKLDMRPYMLDEVIKKDKALVKEKQEEKVKEVVVKQEEEGKEEKIKVDKNEDQMVENQEELVQPTNLADEEFEYDLVGIVIHMGGAEAGHYLSYAVSPKGWLEFNDSCVTEFDFERLVEEKCFGTRREQQPQYFYDEQPGFLDQQHSAYMLVYDKKVKTPFRVDLEQATVERARNIARQTLGCESAAVARDAASADREQEMASLPRCFTLFPGLLAQMLKEDGVCFDPLKKEYYAMVDSQEFRGSVPMATKIEVLQDNYKFLSEKQVFSGSFYDTSAHLFESMLATIRAKPGFDPVSSQPMQEQFLCLEHLIFELVSNSRDLKSLPALTAQLLQISGQNNKILIHLVNNRILKESPDEKSFFELLVFHQDPEVRTLCSKLLQHVYVKVFTERAQNFQSYDQQGLQYLDDILHKLHENVLRMMPVECAKAWWKLDAYFDFLYNMCVGTKKDGVDFDYAPELGTYLDPQLRPILQNYFVTSKLVTKLVDTLTKFTSAQFNNSYMIPPFGKAVDVISTLIRKQPLLRYQYHMGEHNTHHQAGPEDLQAELQADPTLQSPFYQSEEPLWLPKEEWNSLFMEHSKRQKTFYKILMKADYNSEQLAQIVGHLCWKNYEMSRRVGKAIIDGLNKINLRELVTPLRVMQTYLSIADEFQIHRVEWILGYPDASLYQPPNSYHGEYRLDVFSAGAMRIGHVAEPTYSYQTNIFKEAQGLREPLLQSIYTYRQEKYMDAAHAQLDALLETVSKYDKNGCVLRYLLTIEGPAYTSGRYWDWIEPFVIDSGKVAGATPEWQQRFTQMHEYVQNIKQLNPLYFDSPTPELLQIQPGGCRAPESYVIWDTINAPQLFTKKDDERNICLNVVEMITNVSRSNPTGRGNDVLLKGRKRAKKEKESREDEEAVEMKKVNPENEVFIEEVKVDKLVESEEEEYQELATVLAFILRNYHQREQIVVLRFKQEMRDQVNFRMPFGEVPIKIAEKHDKIILRATKLRPMADWGPIEDCFELAFREKNQQQQVQQQYQPLRGNNVGNNPVSGLGGGSDYAQDDERPEDTGEAGGAQKSCAVCTFMNEWYLTVCEMCQSPLN